VPDSAVSSETANRRISSDMSGPLSDKPVGTTLNAQVINTCLPAEKCPYKTPIFITGISDARAFLALLHAQLRGENLMVAPSTADVF